MTLPYRYLKLLIQPIPRMKIIQYFSTSQAWSQQQIQITGSLAKMMKKAQKQKKKQKGKTSKFIPEFSYTSSETTRNFGPSEGSKRRAQQVSLVLYDYVTQIMTSGDLSPKIAALMVEVTQVKMLPDFTAIHIYWQGSSTDRDDEIGKLLKEKEVKMRTLLTAYRPIAKIPQIVFLRDDHEARLSHLNKLFDTADYGENYELSTENHREIPQDPIHHIDKSKANEIKRIGDRFEDGETEIIHMNSQDENQTDQLKSTLYNAEKFQSDNLNSNSTIHKCIRDEYRDNLYGLNHSELKKKIQVWGHKLRHRKGFESASPPSSVNLDSTSPGKKKWKKNQIYKFDYIDTSLSDYMEDKQDEKYDQYEYEEKYDEYEQDNNYDNEDKY